MTIRRKLQLVYVLILLATVGIGVLAVWSVASWQRASMALTYSHVQGERVERVRGDIYRQVKEVVDWLTQEDKDADEEFRTLAGVINREMDSLEAGTKREEERLAVQGLRRPIAGYCRLPKPSLRTLGQIGRKCPGWRKRSRVSYSRNWKGVSRRCGSTTGTKPPWRSSGREACNN